MTLIDHLLESGRVPEAVPAVKPRNIARRAETATVADDSDHGPAPRPGRLDHYQASPEATKMLAAVHGYIARCGLPARLLDLVYLRVSQLNGCAYCIDMHSQDLLSRGLSVAHLTLLPTWSETGAIFDDRELAALAWAEVVTNLGRQAVPDRAYDAAAAVFTEKQLSDLTIAIALMNAYNRLAISFRTTPRSLAN